MPSNYPQFEIGINNNDGTITLAPNTNVKASKLEINNSYDPLDAFSLKYNATDLGVTLTSNASGIVVAGTLNVPAGTLIAFRLENFQGFAGTKLQYTS